MKIDVGAALAQSGIAPAAIQEAAAVLQQLGLKNDISEFAPLQGGMCNHLFVFTAAGQRYLLRLPGQGSEYTTDRAHEAAVYHALRGEDFTDPVLYISAASGIKVSRYLPDTRTCDPANRREVAACLKLLRRFHEKKLVVPHSFDIFQEIELYEARCGIRHDALPDFAKVRAQVLSLRKPIEAREQRDRLCHIDPNYDNFLLNDSVHLIDWEFAGMCDPRMDLAMACIYAYYDRPMTDWVIDEYYEGQAQTADRLLVYAYMAAGAYLWVLWSEIKRESGVDYREYEQQQYRLCQEYGRYAMELFQKD